MRLFSCLLWALLTAHFAAHGQSAGDSIRRSIAVRRAVAQRQAVTETAAKYVGTREVGQNRGPVYELFMKPYGYRPGTLYCGLFCHHVFVIAEVKHGVKGPALAANWATPARVIVWRNNHSVGGRVPLAGDLALYKFGGKRINHVEIIINWPVAGNYCWVIGGNTTNPDGTGEGVFLKKRLKSEMIVVSRIHF